jgi:two-component system phosphate regulon sensor histidine kinase PhoR|tara:strand:- start:12590 stop:14350 length:1761 start_codon:yes stop_codon:yes gene_type:complete
MGIRSRIFLLVFLLLTSSIGIAYIIAERDLTKAFELQIVNELEKQAGLLAASIDDIGIYKTIEEADAIADSLGEAANSRVTFILNNGKVVGDSNLDINQIRAVDNHIDRAEVSEALKNGSGWVSRYSDTLKQDLLYFAVKDGNLSNPNIIRISVPLNYLESAAATLQVSVILLFVVVFIVSVFASLVAANYLYSNIQELAKAATNIAEGDYKKRDIRALPTQRVDEFGTVARSISQISEDLKSQIKMIAKQRDQFGLVLDDLGEGILVTNQQGDIVYNNEQSLIILNTKDLDKQNISSLNLPAINYLFNRVTNKKRADIEFEIELQDKSTRWVLGSMNQSKTTGEYILVVHDITQLRQLNSMRRDFISNLSHELRTPVSVIMANSETLLNGALDNKKDAKIFAKAILHNSERLSSMVSDLIDLSRIEYGDLKLNIKGIDFNDFMESFLVSMKSVAKKRDIELKYNPDHQGLLSADTQALERIMNNLLDNAYKYSDEGTLVEVSTKDQGKMIKVMVADSGVGVSDEDQEHIFDRFYRTASARASDNKGSGLGLAIVKNLINSLNGEVGITPKKTSGSIFWFTIPKSK